MIRLLLLVPGLALVLFAQHARAAVVFSDGSFDDADWSLMLSAGSSGGTAMAGQAADGGNPGSFRDVQHEVNSTSGLVQAFHFNPAFVYEPGASGAIASVAWLIDFQNFQAGQAAALLIEQGGVFTVADIFTTTPVGLGAWNTHAQSGITAADFGITPDFSSSAPAISFGFLTANSGQVGMFQVGYDNLEITITAVPEPSSLILVLVVFLATTTATWGWKGRCLAKLAGPRRAGHRVQ
jgi:hypothetical protein